MTSRMLGFGTLAVALLFAAALPLAAFAGNTLQIANPGDGGVVYSDTANLVVVTDLSRDIPVKVFLNSHPVQGFTAPTGEVGGLKEGKNSIKVVAGSLETSVTFKSEP